jgi:predicted O-methyltransferase YrrM
MRSETAHPRVEYIRKFFAQEDKFLRMSREAAKSLSLPINIGSEEGKLIQLLIHSIGAKKAIEIGTLTGYSAIWIARALGERGILYSLERTPRHAAIARNIIEQASLSHMIQVIDGEAEKELKNIASLGKFDFIFIDANKSSYPYYLEWAKENVRRGGIIVADNTYLFDSVYLDDKPESITNSMWTQMKKFNEIASTSEGFESIMLPTTEGLTILLKTAE